MKHLMIHGRSMPPLACEREVLSGPWKRSFFWSISFKSYFFLQALSTEMTVHYYLLCHVFELGIFINNLVGFSTCNVLFIYRMSKVRQVRNELGWRDAYVSTIELKDAHVSINWRQASVKKFWIYLPGIMNTMTPFG